MGRPEASEMATSYWYTTTSLLIDVLLFVVMGGGW